jgi:hypothetical protein
MLMRTALADGRPEWRAAEAASPWQSCKSKTARKYGAVCHLLVLLVTHLDTSGKDKGSRERTSTV